MVCIFSGWVEAFPTRAEKSREVIRALLREIIPRYGLPLTLGSDNGPAFVSKVVQVAKLLNITWKLHTTYRPPSSGKVERMNRTPKETLAKFHQETGLPWMDLLPLALFRVRNAPNPSGYTPYKLVFGRPPAVLSLPRGELWLQGELNQTRHLQQLGRALERIAKAGLGQGPQPRGGQGTPSGQETMYG